VELEGRWLSPFLLFSLELVPIESPLLLPPLGAHRRGNIKTWYTSRWRNNASARYSIYSVANKPFFSLLSAFCSKC